MMVAPAWAASNDEELAKVRQQFNDYCLAEDARRGDRLLDDIEVPKNKVAEGLKWARAIKDDGAFADLDYESKARSAWVPYSHLTRMLSTIVYAQHSTTPPADRDQCLAAIHRGLSFWMKNDFKCPNWWYNEIGVPKVAGTIALLLKDGLKDEERKFIVDTILVRSKVGAMTGQNRVWLAANGVMRGLLSDDAALVKKAAVVIAEELVVSDKTTVEGIQADWSFHQHGSQLQFGNYGMAFAVEMSRWSAVLRETSFALSLEKQEILRNYMLRGQNWIIWRDVMDISACGRQLVPNSPAQKANAIEGVMRTLAEKETDATARKAFNDFLERQKPGAKNDLLGNRYFFRSDYMIHRTADLMVSLKMHSPRVIGGENTNTENNSGVLLADGATMIYSDGQDYQNIFPSWDWRKIPGITAEIKSKAPTWGEAKTDKTGAMVGGVSDGSTGVACMDFSRAGVSAKKAWFFSGNRVYCLGADIQSPAGAAVMTTIQQTLLRGSIEVKRKGGPVTMKTGEERFGDVESLTHHGVRYRLLGDQPLVVSAQPRTGNWSLVFTNPATPKADVTCDLFTVSIDHSGGKSPTYAYVIEPANEPADGAVQIQNEAHAQAIVRSDWAGIVFWSAGQCAAGGLDVGVDSPCVVMLDRTHNAITVADPTQKLDRISIRVGSATKSVSLPTGVHAGESVKVP